MTTEQKAKAYDEALQRARELNSGKDVDAVAGTTICEYIFPELKESEDEKMRKSIIYALQNGGFYSSDKTDEAIAWLEKQGKQKTEPKFHPGDWITHNTANFVFKIINVGSNGYEVVNRENYKKTISFDNEGNYRLWTIEDAKDGDVLVANGKRGQEVGIAKEFIGKYGGHDKCFETYCYSDLDGTFRIGEYMGGASIHPATKEQRDLLFQKMADEGYEWNAEKKELKTIEQKHVDNVEPKFKVGDWIVLPLGIIAHIESLNSTDYQVTTTDGKICDFKISKQDNYRLWSIEDSKDGDVLYSPCLSLLWIFKSKDTIYCGCNLNYNDGAFCGEGYFEITTDAIPATKEQRDALERAMTNAGYEWDNEKKELKKIKSKLIDSDKVIEWLNDQACLGWIEDVEVDKFIAKFKKDFGL